MRRLLGIGLAVLMIGVLGGCFHQGAVITGTGTVVFVDLEGGFYGIETDDGQRLEPANLRSEFKEDGLRVRFEARRIQEVATIFQWGQPVDILAIERIEGTER